MLYTQLIWQLLQNHRITLYLVPPFSCVFLLRRLTTKQTLRTTMSRSTTNPPIDTPMRNHSLSIWRWQYSPKYKKSALWRHLHEQKNKKKINSKLTQDINLFKWYWLYNTLPGKNKTTTKNKQKNLVKELKIHTISKRFSSRRWTFSNNKDYALHIVSSTKET